MLTIALVSLKGGVGKSTLACNLAACLAGSLRVVLVDADTQGSTAAWGARAVESGREGVPVVAMAPSSLVRDLPKLASSFDVAIIDTPARLGVAARGAIMACDVALVPCGPSAIDVWATHETVAVIEEAQALRPELLARIVLNRANHTRGSRSAEKALADFPIPMLGTSLGNRALLAEAMGLGLGVTDHDAKSDAAMEVRRMTRELVELVGGAQVAA